MLQASSSAQEIWGQSPSAEVSAEVAGQSSGQVFANGECGFLFLWADRSSEALAKFSGLIGSAVDLGAVTVRGRPHGGENFRSGEIYAGGKLVEATVGGSLIATVRSRVAESIPKRTWDLVTIKKDVQGGGSFRARLDRFERKLSG